MLCSSDMRSLKCIVSSIKYQKNAFLRIALLRMIYDIFDFQIPAVASRFSFSSFKLTPENIRVSLSILKENDPLGYSYKALLLQIFLKIDLIGAISSVFGDENNECIFLAVILIQNLSELAMFVLPPDDFYGISYLSLEKLFSASINFSDEEMRHLSNSSLEYIDILLRNSLKKIKPICYFTENFNDNFDSLKKTNSVLSTADDSLFLKNLLLESNVLITRDYTKWQWEQIEQIISFAASSSKRQEDFYKNSGKFIKRILSFFSPNKSLFSLIPKGQHQIENILSCGNNLIKFLLNSADGLKQFSEHRFLRQILEKLEGLYPVSNFFVALFTCNRYKAMHLMIFSFRLKDSKIRI